MDKNYVMDKNYGIYIWISKTSGDSWLRGYNQRKATGRRTEFGNLSDKTIINGFRYVVLDALKWYRREYGSITFED